MRKALMTIMAVWALALGASACDGAADPIADPIPESAVRASATEDGLRLTNPTANTIYYLAFEHDWATRGLFLWAPCTDPASCPSAEAGATVTIPYSAIGGYTPEAREALVYYWELIPDGSGYRADEVHSLTASF